MGAEAGVDTVRQLRSEPHNASVFQPTLSSLIDPQGAATQLARERDRSGRIVLTGMHTAIGIFSLRGGVDVDAMAVAQPDVGVGSIFVGNFGRSSGAAQASAIVRTMVNNAFDALASPIRRDIVERLACGPSTVGAATSGLAVSKPAISRHLKVLEDAGVIGRTVEGRTHRLRLNVDALDEAADWLERQCLVWERMFDAVEGHLGAVNAGGAGSRPDGGSLGSHR